MAVMRKRIEPIDARANRIRYELGFICGRFIAKIQQKLMKVASNAD